MKNAILTTLLAVTLSSCASLGSGPNAVKRTLAGATAGAAIGAAAGGINGAGLGLAAGGTIGALMPGNISKVANTIGTARATATTSIETANRATRERCIAELSVSFPATVHRWCLLSTKG